MFTRKKLRKIFERNRQDFEKDYFQKLKTPKDKNQLNRETDDVESTYKKKKNFKDFTTADVAAIVKTHCFNWNSMGKSMGLVNTVPELEPNTIDYAKLETFHRAVRPIFLLAQCFAIMPVAAVNDLNPRHMHFSYKSIQMLVTAIFLTSNGLLLMAMTKHLTGIGINAKNFVGLVFFLCCEVACVMFVVVAKRWPNLIQYWTRLELTFTRSPYEEPKRNLRKRVRLAAFAIVFCSILEHILYQFSSILSYRRKILICSQLHNKTSQMSFRDYITSNYDYAFDLFTYHSSIGIFILVISGVSTFVWNYMDLFIMMISNGIAYRFEQIMMRINKIADQEVAEQVFIEIREHYVQVCELLDKVDENLSGVILLSCVNNLYFVCYQLLNIFNKLRWPINYIYFWYSLIYLIGRTAFVFLTAASINDQSKAALSSLRSVSHRIWCIEVERLIFQMTTQTIALSGKKFYFLTRRLLFGVSRNRKFNLMNHMAGTIVTYELVLLQFDEPNRSQGLPPLCK